MIRALSLFVFTIGLLLVLLREYVGVDIKWYVLPFPFAISIITFILSYLNIRIPNKVRIGIIILCYTCSVISIDKLLDLLLDLELQLWVCILTSFLYIIGIFTLSFYQ